MYRFLSISRSKKDTTAFLNSYVIVACLNVPDDEKDAAYRRFIQYCFSSSMLHKKSVLLERLQIDIERRPQLNYARRASVYAAGYYRLVAILAVTAVSIACDRDKLALLGFALWALCFMLREYQAETNKQLDKDAVQALKAVYQWVEEQPPQDLSEKKDDATEAYSAACTMV